MIPRSFLFKLNKTLLVYHSGRGKSMPINFVKIIQKRMKKFYRNNEISLDRTCVHWYTTRARARKTGVLCDEAGDCSQRRGNFRGVCPVSGWSWYAIGRLKPIRYTRISRARDVSRPNGRFVFRVRSDTHGCVYRILEVSSERIKAEPMPRKNVRKKEKTPWQATTKT